MSRDILFAIKPKYAEMIYVGEKKYELRKKMPQLFAIGEDLYSLQRNMKYRVFIYESSPVQRVTGYMLFDAVVYGDVDSVWEKYQEFLGVTLKEYTEYTDNQRWIYAARIAKVFEFDEPYQLNHRPPQNFMYTDRDTHPQTKGVIENETAEIG